jgi:hypothetical protein
VVDQVRSWFATLSPWGTVFIAVAAYIGGVLVWGTRIDYRVSNIEARLLIIDTKISALYDSDHNQSDKLLLLDERQQGVLRTLEANARRLDTINSTVQDTNNLLRNHDERFNPKNRMNPENGSK